MTVVLPSPATNEVTAITSGRSRTKVSSIAVRSWRNDSSRSGIDFDVIKGRSGRFRRARTRGIVASTGRCSRERASTVGIERAAGT